MEGCHEATGPSVGTRSIVALKKKEVLPAAVSMSSYKAVAARRLAIFRSAQQFVLHNGEWIIVPEHSDPPVSQLANDFFKTHNVIPVFVSPPDYRLIQRSDNPPQFIISISISVLYEPKEAVVDETQIATSSWQAAQQEFSVRYVFEPTGHGQSIAARPADEGVRIVRQTVDTSHTTAGNAPAGKLPRFRFVHSASKTASS